MQFNYRSNESQIYDFLHFPSLLYYKKRGEHTGEVQDYNHIEDEEYMELVSKAKHRLNPYEKDIACFYTKDFIRSYEFIDLITNVHPIERANDALDYLDHLLTLDDQDIKQALIQSIMYLDHDGEDANVNYQKLARDIIENNADLLGIIKELPIDDSYKWNLFLIVGEPQKYMRKFVKLMCSLHPIFLELYLSFKDSVDACGNRIADVLNQSGEQGFESLTYQMIDAKFLDHDYHKFYVSVMFSNVLVITSDVQSNIIIWGLKMEEAFKRIQEINENKTLERVQIFKNLGDKTRYEVLKLIASGVTSTKEIANTLGVSSATISYHINAFVTSKVIRLDKNNKKLGYVVDYALLEEAIESFKEDLLFPQKTENVIE
jgi:DNA-binding transcriptional ArsR family regulator